MDDRDPARPDLRALWDFADPAGSEARFRALAAASEGVARELALTQVARALGLQDRFEEGYAVLAGLGGGQAGTAGRDPELEVRVALERGRLTRSGGDPQGSRAHFEEAAAGAAAAGLEELHLDALHMLAIVAPAQEAEAITLRALDVARAATDPRARDWDASLLNNLGMTYADAGDFDRALPTFKAALAACERIGDPERIRVARWMIAWALRNLGRRDEARVLQLALRAELSAAGASDVYVEEELALLEDGDG